MTAGSIVIARSMIDHAAQSGECRIRQLGATRAVPRPHPGLNGGRSRRSSGTDTYALGINNKGDVVGANSSPGGEEGFVYSDGKILQSETLLG